MPGLQFYTKITLVDGTKKQIDELFVGDKILGYKDKKCVETFIQSISTEPFFVDEWVKLHITTRGNMYEYGEYYPLTCTKKQLVYSTTKNDYIEAENLSEDDKVYVFFNKKLSEQIIISKKRNRPVLTTYKQLFRIQTLTNNFFASDILVKGFNPK